MTEDGKPQSVQTFKLINVSDDTGVGTDPPREVRNPIEEQTEAARDDVRLFAIFLDDYHVRLENSMRAREPIARFVQVNQCERSRGHIIRCCRSTSHAVTEPQQLSAPSGSSRAKYYYTPRNASKSGTCTMSDTSRAFSTSYAAAPRD